MKDRSKVKGIILFALQIGVVTSSVAMILLYFLSPLLSTSIFNNPKLLAPLKIFLISIPPLSILTIYEGISRAFKRVEYTVYSHNIIYSIINLIAALFALYFGFGIMGISYGFFVSALAALAVIFILVEKNAFRLFESTKPTFMRKELLNFSWPLVLAGMFGLIIGWTDTIIIGYFMDETYVGLYNSVIPTVNLLLTIPFAVVALLVPTTVELLSKNKLNEIKQSYTMSTEWIFFINFPILLVFILFSQQILNVLFGIDYIGAGTALIVLSIGFFMYSVSYPALKMLELLNKTKFYMVLTAFAAFLNIALNFMLIPQYGINGAAIASAVSLTIIFIVSIIKIGIIEKYILPSTSFIKAAIAALAILIGLYVLSKFIFKLITPILLIPLVCIYLGLYSLVLYKFVLRKEEIELINTVFSKFKLKQLKT